MTEDSKMTPEAMAAANERSTGAIAKEIGNKLPGPLQPPGGAALLPAVSLLPLGIGYYPKDALGLTAIGPVAVGFYKDGEKRWRDVAIVRGDAAGAGRSVPCLQAATGQRAAQGRG